MFSTPLSDNCILEELKDINKVNYIWPDAIKVNLYTITHSLITLDKIIKDNPDKNLHIFLNSINTIKKVVSALPFKERELKWNKKTSIKEYLPSYITKRRTIDGKRVLYFYFHLN